MEQRVWQSKHAFPACFCFLCLLMQLSCPSIQIFHIFKGTDMPLCVTPQVCRNYLGQVAKYTTFTSLLDSQIKDWWTFFWQYICILIVGAFVKEQKYYIWITVVHFVKVAKRGSQDRCLGELAEGQSRSRNPKAWGSLDIYPDTDTCLKEYDEHKRRLNYYLHFRWN